MCPSMLLSLLVVACLAACVAVAARIPPPADSFEAWAVVTATDVDTGGDPTLRWRYGQVAQRSAPDSVLCLVSQQRQFPRGAITTATVVARNGSSVVQVEDPRGFATCAAGASPSELRAPWLYGPSPSVLAAMSPAAAPDCGSVPCDAFTATVGGPTPLQRSLLTWAVGKDGTPLRYTNETWSVATNAGLTLSVAFQGYHSLGPRPALSKRCAVTAASCGGSAPFCSVSPSAPPGKVQGALSWACSGGAVNCTALTAGPDNYPATLTAHATWAFNAYYQRHVAQGPGACAFGGAAVLTACPGRCTRCAPLPAAAEADLADLLAQLCPSTDPACAPIRPGGARYEPATVRAHVAWALQNRYAALRCVPGLASVACPGNLTHLVPC